MKVERSRWNEISCGKVEKESSKTEAHRNKRSGHEEENECQGGLEEWGLGIDQWGEVVRNRLGYNLGKKKGGRIRWNS